MIIKLRRGNASLWTQINPILHEGEVGIESNTNKFKFGNGNKPWNDLPYAVPDDRVTSVSGRTGTIVLDKDDVGLSQVDNTSDADKPISNAVSAALAALSSTVSTQLDLVLDLDRLKAPLASPAFTGNPTAPTPAVGDNDTSIATTAFVKSADDAMVSGKNLANVDLDTVTTPGVYHQSTAANATLALHYPIDNGLGVLEVFNRGSSPGAEIQRYTVQSGGHAGVAGRGIYVRRRNANVWTAWTFLTNPRFTQSLAIEAGTELKFWDDAINGERSVPLTRQPLTDQHLNTVIIPGQYQMGSASIAKAVNGYPRDLNQPVVLEVLPMGGWLLQRLTTISFDNSTARGFWQRKRHTTEWGPWSFIPSMRFVNPSTQPGVEAYVWDDSSSAERQLSVAGLDLGTVDLNAVTLAGSYSQQVAANVTLARNYPRAGILGVLEVRVINSGNILQMFYGQSGTGAQGGKGFWIRRMSSGGTWDPWTFIASQRVDNTAGRAIYTWDDTATREQLIYGDTGERNISELLNPAVTGSLFLRRHGAMIYLHGEIAPTADLASGAEVNLIAGDGNLPVGFRRGTGAWARQPFRVSGNPTIVQYIKTTGAPALTIGQAYTTAQGSIRFIVQWMTSDQWPSTLPGIVSYGPPNL